MKPYYQDELVTLYHGDCREILPTISADAVVSDPPYGMSLDVDNSRFSGGHNPARRGKGLGKRERVKGDDEPFDPSPFIGFRECVLFGFNHFGDRLPPGSALVWIKKNDAAFGTFLSDAEIAWKKGGCGVYCYRDLSNYAIANERTHPTQKPVPLMRWVIGHVSGSVIVDPFAGVGTTGIAAADIGRRCVLVEIEERYCEIAARRLSSRTGNLFA